MMRRRTAIFAASLLAAGAAGFPLSDLSARESPAAFSAPPAVTYADLADLADSAPLALRAQVKRMSALKPEETRGVRQGWGRFYIEAKTRTLIAGNAVLGGSLRYLADLPLDQRGKPPAIKGKDVLVFARTVPGRPGELQLVAPDAQILWDAQSEARLRAILTELQAPGAPKRVSGVREVINVPGNLAEAGETQMFLATVDGSAASIIVNRRPGQAPSWGVTFSEVLDDSLRAPQHDTLTWYRLACFLPRQLPQGVNLSATSSERAQADADYRFVLSQLGPCGRTRR